MYSRQKLRFLKKVKKMKEGQTNWGQTRGEEAEKWGQKNGNGKAFLGLQMPPRLRIFLPPPIRLPSIRLPFPVCPPSDPRTGNRQKNSRQKDGKGFLS